LVFLGEICLLFGLPGLYVSIAPKTGLLRLLGFLLYFFANATLASFVSAYEAFIVPVLAADSTTSALVAPGGVIPSSAPFAVLQGLGGRFKGWAA
jgi:cytochrome c oxidase assembly factor CtaG